MSAQLTTWQRQPPAAQRRPAAGRAQRPCPHGPAAAHPRGRARAALQQRRLAVDGQAALQRCERAPALGVDLLHHVAHRAPHLRAARPPPRSPAARRAGRQGAARCWHAPNTQQTDREPVLGAGTAGAGAPHALRARRAARAAAGRTELLAPRMEAETELRKLLSHSMPYTSLHALRNSHTSFSPARARPRRCAAGRTAAAASLGRASMHPAASLDRSTYVHAIRVPKRQRSSSRRLPRHAGRAFRLAQEGAPPPRIGAGSRHARRARAGRAPASCASASTAPRYASSCRRRSSTNSPLWLCGKMRLAGRRRRYAGTPRSARCSASKLRKRRDTVHSASASATRTCTARAAPAGAFRTAAGAGAAPGRQAGRGAERALDGSLLDSPRAKGAGRRIRHATAGSAPCTRPHPCCPRCSARRPPPARVAALARLSAGGGRAAGCMHARSARRPVVQLRAARARAHCARAGAPCARASRLAARGGARLGQWPPRKAAPPPRVAVQGVQAAGQAATAARQRGRVARHRRQRAHSLAWAGDSRLCAAAVRLGARGPVERARAQRAARQRAGAGRRAAVVGAPRAAARRAPGRHLPTERGA